MQLLTVPGDDLVTDVAKVPKELVVMLLAVRQTLLLVVPVPVEGLLAFGAHEVLQHSKRNKLPLVSSTVDKGLGHYEGVNGVYRMH